MDVLSMCRICLIKDVNMHRLVNTKLQEIYEKLTAMSFQSVDSRPLQVCYLCYGKLQNCYRLQINCIKSEELFTEILTNNQLKPKQLLDMNTLKIVHPLVQLSCEVMDVNVMDVNVMDVNVKVKHDDEEEHNMAPEDMIHEHIKQEYIEAAEDNVTDNELLVEYTGGTDIVKYEYITIEDNNMLNYSTNTVHENYDLTSKCDKVTLQHTKPDAVLQNPKLNESGNIRSAPSNKSKMTATLENNKKCKTKKPTKNKQKVNRTSVQNCEHPFKCDICGKRFIRTNHLKQHSRVHTGEKPYKCDMCEKSFNQKQHLTQHIRLHTGEKPYKCDVCEKSFNQKQHLTQHIRLHTGEKPFKCDMCDKSFTRKHHLMSHKNIHTGEKPYKCDICDKCFMRTQDLFLHNRRHTGVKPFKCDFCEKAFYRNHDLIKHTRRHTGEKPYKCDM